MATQPREELRFHEAHRLPGWVFAIVISSNVFALLLVIMLAASGRVPGSTAGIIVGVVLLVEAAIVWWMLRLRFNIAVTDRALYVRVTPWIFRRRVPLEGVTATEVVPMPGKVGVQWSPRVWCISPGTARGVRVQLAGGKSLLIGVEQPEAMLAAMARDGPDSADAADASAP